jgi:hypothetical protein
MHASSHSNVIPSFQAMPMLQITSSLTDSIPASKNLIASLNMMRDDPVILTPF